MKQFAILLLIFSTLGSFAQISERVEVDCQSVSKSLHATLGTGKAVLVASKGFDCSICQNRAQGFQNWASNHSNQVDVWAAMTFTYSAQVPDCSDVTNWVSTYNWNDVFTFIDSSEYYFEFGTPRYLVFDPADSSQVYVGSNESEAFTAALNASSPQLSSSQSALKKIDYRLSFGQLEVLDLPRGKHTIQLVNLLGQKQREISSTGTSVNMSVADLRKGVYLLRIISEGRGETTRKIPIQ